MDKMVEPPPTKSAAQPKIQIPLNDYPQEPGVYLMANGQGTIIYIGKAINLRNRIKQYFASHGDGRLMIPYLVAEVVSINVIVVLSEREALILENNLIKKYQPKYNTLLKDDKGYVRLKISIKDEWPTVQLARYKTVLDPHALYFGPFPSTNTARDILKTLQAIFPLRRCSDYELSHRQRPCLLYQLHRCMAPCVGKCTPEEYREQVGYVVDFLKGRSDTVLNNLKELRKHASEMLEFERAAEYHRLINLIEDCLAPQVVDQISDKDRDLIGLYREANQVALAQLFVRKGRLISIERYYFPNTLEDDEEVLSSFLLQHYAGKEELPDEIFLPMGLENRYTIETILSEEFKKKMRITSPQRGDKGSLIEIAQKNALVTFQQLKGENLAQENLLFEVQEQFNLSQFPERIDCFDNSHLGGSETVAAMIVFINGKKAKNHYRKYKIKTVSGGDDYGALEEALLRRYRRAKAENTLPDLILIDGGKGHLAIAYKVLLALDLAGIDCLAISKEKGRHDKGLTSEIIHQVGQDEPIHLPKNSPVLFFFQRIRDEAHRVAISFQRLLRGQKSLSSPLTDIPGIGEKKRHKIFQHFGSYPKIQNATLEELQAVPGITAKDAELLYTTLRTNGLPKNAPPTHSS